MDATRCKKCGRRLRDPESIARGMGPECAGMASGGKKKYCPSRKVHRGSAYLLGAEGTASPTLFTLIQKEKQSEDVTLVHEEASGRSLTDIFRQFPTDLVDLVLSAPPASSLAPHAKLSSRRKEQRPGLVNPGKALKEIRRMCIEIRLAFWPGISHNGHPIACVPYGEKGWKLENSEKIMSRAELEAYLARYGMIGPAKQADGLSTSGTLRPASITLGQEA